MSVATPVAKLVTGGTTGALNSPRFVATLIIDGCTHVIVAGILFVAVQQLTRRAYVGQSATSADGHVMLPRVLIWAVFLAQALALLAVGSLMVPSGVWNIALVYVTRAIAQIAAYFAFPCVLFHHLGALTSRIPARKLSGCLIGVGLLFLVATGLMLFEAVIMFTFEIAEGPSRPIDQLARDVLFYVHPLTTCLHLPLGILAFVLLLVSRRAIGRATYLAESFLEQ